MTDPDPIRVEGSEEAELAFHRLVIGLSDLRPFWPRVSRLFIGWMRLTFDSEGSFWGSRWTPLSQEYAARKRVLWGDRPILQASGQAKRAASKPTRIPRPLSLTLIIDDAGPEHEAILSYHQTGGDPPGSAPYPARPIIGETLPPLANYELTREAEAYVVDLLGRH